MQSALSDKIEKYRPIYRSQLTKWPVPVEEKTIETASGRMHILSFGTPNGSPLLVLHGGGGTSVGWIFQAEALAKSHRVYALDLPGHCGLSVASRPLLKVEDTMKLLDEVLDALGLATTQLLGISLGGAYACHYALRSHKRVTRLVLIAPAPLLLPLRISFFLHNILLLPGTAFVERFFRWLGPESNRGTPAYEGRLALVCDWFSSARRHFGLPNMMGMEWPTILQDDQLRSLAVPTAVIIGVHEVVYDARRAMDRAKLIPSVETVLIEGAGHDLMWSQPARLNQAITDFLSKDTVR